MNNKFKIEDTDVVILCGGKGERLRHLVNGRPKPMAEINGRPFLDILIDYVTSFGFRRFILCTGYKGDLIRRYYNAKESSLKIIFSHEKRPLGTAGAIKKAEPLIKSNPFLLMNGDSICHLNLNYFINFHIKKGALFSIVLSKTENITGFGKAILDKSGRVIKFSEKIKSKSVDNFVNIGLYLLNKTIFSEIPENKKCSLEYEIFPKIVNRGCYGFITQERFIDIGTPKRFKQAEVELMAISGLVRWEEL